MTKNTWEIFQLLKEEQLSINYLGEFKDSATDFLINLSEINFEAHEDFKKLKKKVSFLIAESFQNIVRHSEDTAFKKDLTKSSFFSTRVSSKVIILSSNSIAIKDKEKIVTMIEQVNSLNADELKELYLQILNNSGLSEKGGAGLGLIEMARKSGQKLDYYFEDMDAENTMFYLQIKLYPLDNNYENLANPIEFRNSFIKNRIIFTYKGDFSKETVLNLLDLIENNLNHVNEVKKNGKKIYIVLVELLQNISKHGLKFNDTCEGIFTFGIKNNKLVLSTGNWISIENTKHLTATIDKLNALSEEELKKSYLDKITSEEKHKKEGADVGLINMIRFTKNKISYELHSNSENNSNFITLSISF